MPVEQRPLLHRLRLCHVRAFANPDEQPTDADYRTENREPITVACVESGFRFAPIGSQQHRSLIPRSRLHDSPKRIHRRSNTRVGGAQQPAIVLDRPHSGHVEVLPWSCRLAKPSIVPVDGTEAGRDET